MAFNLRNRHFLKLLDFSPEEIGFLLGLSLDLKKAKYAGFEQPKLTGKNIALIFERPQPEHDAPLKRQLTTRVLM